MAVIPGGLHRPGVLLQDTCDQFEKVIDLEQNLLRSSILKLQHDYEEVAMDLSMKEEEMMVWEEKLQQMQQDNEMKLRLAKERARGPMRRVRPEGRPIRKGPADDGLGGIAECDEDEDAEGCEESDTGNTLAEAVPSTRGSLTDETEAEDEGAIINELARAAASELATMRQRWQELTTRMEQIRSCGGSVPTTSASTALGTGPLQSGPLTSGPLHASPLSTGPLGSGSIGFGPLGSGPFGEGATGSGSPGSGGPSPLGSGAVGSGRPVAARAPELEAPHSDLHALSSRPISGSGGLLAARPIATSGNARDDNTQLLGSTGNPRSSGSVCVAPLRQGRIERGPSPQSRAACDSGFSNEPGGASSSMPRSHTSTPKSHSSQNLASSQSAQSHSSSQNAQNAQNAANPLNGTLGRRRINSVLSSSSTPLGVLTGTASGASRSLGPINYNGSQWSGSSGPAVPNSTAGSGGYIRPIQVVSPGSGQAVGPSGRALPQHIGGRRA